MRVRRTALFAGLVGLVSAAITFTLLWALAGALGLRGGPTFPGGTDEEEVDWRRAPPDREAPRPVRVEIPEIGVSARVIELGLNKDRTLETPNSYTATGWFAQGPEPGERGAAVISGHVDSKAGAAVFYRLHELDRGDDIYVVRPNGSKVRFIVDRTEEHAKDDFPTKQVYTRDGYAELRLITCTGDFEESRGSYQDNLVVFAQRTF